MACSSITIIAHLPRQSIRLGQPGIASRKRNEQADPGIGEESPKRHWRMLIAFLGGVGRRINPRQLQSNP